MQIHISPPSRRILVRYRGTAEVTADVCESETGITSFTSLSTLIAIPLFTTLLLYLIYRIMYISLLVQKKKKKKKKRQYVSKRR